MPTILSAFIILKYFILYNYFSKKEAKRESPSFPKPLLGLKQNRKSAGD